MAQYNIEPLRLEVKRYLSDEQKFVVKKNKYSWLVDLLVKFGVLGSKPDMLQGYEYVNYGEHEKEKLTEHLMGLFEHLYHCGLDPNDYAVVIGGRDFNELLKTELYNNYGFRSSALRVGGGNGYSGYICDYPIHVVSFMSGYSLIPKVVIEKQD